MPGLSVFPFCDWELWCCIILILPCADSQVGLVFNAFFPRVRENIWNHCAYVSHTELETRTGQLPSAAKPDFKSERCYKIRIPYCNLEQCYFPAHTPCWFCFSSLPKEEDSLSHVFFWEAKGTLLHTLLFAHAINIEAEKKFKILWNTTNYSENKIVMVLPWKLQKKKKNPSSNRTRGDGTNWGRSL